MKRVGSLAILPHTGLTKTVAGIVDDIVELVVVLILPPLRSGDGFSKMGSGTPTFFRRLVQIILGQILSAPGQEIPCQP